MRWILYPVAALLVGATVVLATLGTAAVLAWPKLPSLDVLTDYRPRIPLRVYSADGHLLAEFGEERRSLVAIDDVPDNLRHAILAAEDERFYDHPGVDVLGIARAAIANVVSGERGQGASTITMQVARNFFLSREKTYNRKLYEILLAIKIENNLSKDQILELYVNQIFLGQRAYGFRAAARTYFAKPLDELTLAEAAMLAGLPKAPSLYNPVSNLRRATLRQHYVLRRMVAAGFIDEEQFEQARSETLQVANVRAPGRRMVHVRATGGDYVAEMARQIAVEQFGDAAYHLGLNITTTINYEEQISAYQALRKGVFDFDRRRGYRGPEAFVDLEGVADDDDEAIAGKMAEHRDFHELLAGVVLSASSNEVQVHHDGEVYTITGNGLSFAAPMLNERAPQSRRIRRGAVVRLRLNDESNWEIAQLPEVEGSLISIDSKTGAVRALVGGFDFNRSSFNHVTQAYRQPGSVFKPFIYSAALENGFSPATYELDEPLYFPREVTGSKAWEPKNYDNKYDGPMTLREAMARSKNMVSIRLLQSVTPEYAQDYIGRFGFEPERHPAYLTMALGAGAVTPWQLAAGYAVFANGGFRIEPYVIREIADSDGRTLARIDPPVAGTNAPRVIDPRNAWLVDSMLRGVVTNGTAGRARSLGRSDLAGKTGTTNDYVDAWFAGYNPDVVAVSWMGYSQPRNLGRGETGGRAALPVWVDYMSHALKDLPERQLERPGGLLPIRHAGSSHTDYYYQEYPAPEEPPRELADIPELRYFLDDNAWRSPQGEQQAPTGSNGGAPVREAAPAPVEDRSPVMIRR